MMNGFKKWRHLSLLLSFVMLLEASVPLGAATAFAAEPSGTSVQNEEVTEAAVQTADEDELSPDEFDSRGPLSAFEDGDQEETPEPYEEEGIADEALASNDSKGSFTIGFNGSGGAEFNDLTLKDAFSIIKKGWKDTAYLSLQSDFTVGSELKVPDGCDLTIDFAGHTVTGGSSRFLYVPKKTKLTLIGDGWRSKRGKIQDFKTSKNGAVVYANNQAEIVVKNMDIIRNRADKGGCFDLEKQSSLKLYNVCCDGNSAKSRGGVIYIDGTKSNVSMDSSTKLRYNSAGTHGGAIYVNDARAGIYGGAGGTLIEYNSASNDGGGLYVDGANDMRNAGDAIVRNLTFDHNTASGDGGAIYINCGGCSFSDVKATNNQAGQLGGAICDIGSSKPKDRDNSFSNLELTGNKLTKNEKAYGGGLYAAATQNVGLSGKVIVSDNKDNKGNINNIYLWDNKVEHAYLVIGSLAAQSRIGIMRENVKFDKITKKPVFIDLRLVSSDRSDYHLEIDGKTSYLMIKKGSAAEAEKPALTELDLTEWKTKNQKSEYTYTADGQNYDVYYGYASSPSHSNEEVDILNKYFYSDGFFLNDPYTYDIHLATMGMNVAMASADSNIKGHSDYRYKFDNIKSLLQGIGCAEDSIYLNDWYIEKPTDDSIGVAIGKKTIHDKKNNKDYILVPIAIRSYGYEKEWASNMTLNGKNTDGETNAESSGFRSARSHVVDALEYYLDHYGLRDEIKKGNVKFWLNGFSRGSATANLTGKYLVDTYGVYSEKYKSNPNQVFAYCYAVPAGGTDTAEIDAAKADNRKGYYCIHNIINKVDLTPMVAPERMGFKRYGVDHYVPGQADPGTVKEEKKNASQDNGSHQMTLMYDNNAYITGSNEYNDVRQSMLDQLLGVNAEIHFSDYFKVADFSLLGSPHFTPAKKGQMTIESWLPDMYEKVQTWDTLGSNKNLTRSDYSGYQMKEGEPGGKWNKGISAQDAFRGLVMLMLSKTPSEKTALSTALGSITNKLAAIASLEKGPSVLTIATSLIFRNGWEKPKDQQKWLDFFWGKLTDDSHGQPSIKDKSVMSDAELKAFESYFPALMGLAFRLIPKDYKDNNFHLVSTFAFNTETILQGHVPEIYLAWLRRYDSYYEKEAKKAYCWSKGGEKPSAPASDHTSGKYSGTQTIKLTANEGSSIYYTLKKGNEAESPVKLYRSGEGIVLNAALGAEEKYTIKAYAIKDEVTGGKRSWSTSTVSTFEYSIEAKRELSFKDSPDQTEFKKTYLSKGEEISLSVKKKEGYRFNHWEAEGITLTNYQKSCYTLKITMPDNNVRIWPVYNPEIYKVKNVVLAKQPVIKGKTSNTGNIASIELEDSAGKTYLYTDADKLTSSWIVYEEGKEPRSSELNTGYAKESKYFTGKEWLYITPPDKFVSDGNTIEFSSKIRLPENQVEGRLYTEYKRLGNIGIAYKPTSFVKPEVKAVTVPEGRQYPYCADSNAIKAYLEKETVTLTLADNSTVGEAVEWDASSYTANDEGGSYTFTGAIKDASSFDLSKVSAPSITVNVAAKTLSPVPTVDIVSGKYVNEAGYDEDLFKDDALVVTASVQSYEDTAGTIRYKLEEYTGAEPTTAPAYDAMTDCPADGKISLQGVKNQTKKFKLWLRGNNTKTSVNVSEAVGYTYEVTVPKYQTVTVEVYDVNKTDSALYTTEPESVKVGEPYYIDEDFVLEQDEKLDGYQGAYWIQGTATEKTRDHEYFIEAMPDQAVTLKLYAAKTLGDVLVIPEGYIIPEKGYELDTEIYENQVTIGDKVYTLSGNQVTLGYTPDDKAAKGNTVYSVSGTLDLAGMKGKEDGGETQVELGGKYTVSADFAVRIESDGEEDIVTATDVTYDEDGLATALSFGHTFDSTEAPAITDVYDELEEIQIPWTDGTHSYDATVKPKLPSEVRVITDDGSLSSIPVTWDHAAAYSEYKADSVKPQNLEIGGTAKVPDGYIGYDPLHEGEKVEEYRVSVNVFFDGAPSVITPKPDPDGATVQCSVVKDKDGNETDKVEGSIDVVLTCETKGADIYYTTDDTDPVDTEGKPVSGAAKYTAGSYVTIKGKPGDEIMLKAAAVKSGMQSSEVYANVFNFTKPEAEIPEEDIDFLFDLYIEKGSKLDSITLPDGWHWDTEYMDDPATLPEEEEDEVGNDIETYLYYNPDPSKYENAEFDLYIPIDEKAYTIETGASKCMTYEIIPESDVDEKEKDDYTEYKTGYYLSDRIYAALPGAKIAAICAAPAEGQDLAGWIIKTESGKDITPSETKVPFGPGYAAEFTMPEENVIVMPYYKEKSSGGVEPKEYTVEGLAVSKSSLEMKVYEEQVIDLDVTYSAAGEGDKPQPEYLDIAEGVEVNIKPENTEGKYKVTIKAVKPGEGTIWFYCGSKAEPVTYNVKKEELCSVTVNNGVITKEDGKDVTENNETRYVKKGSTVTVKANAPAEPDVMIFDSWDVKGAVVEDTAKQEITFTVTGATEANAYFKQDPAYSEDMERKDVTVPVKKLTLLGSDGSKSIVFDISDDNVTPQASLTATATYNPGSEPEITFASSNKSVVMVKRTGDNKTGTVTASIIAKDPGEAYVYAYCGKKSAKIKVEVAYKSNGAGLFIDDTQYDQLEMKAGEQKALIASVIPFESTDTVTGISWKTSNSKVLSVSKGLITAKAAGEAKVTATLKVKPAGTSKTKAYTAECAVKVAAVENDKPKSKQNDKNYKLSLNKSSLKLDRTASPVGELTVKIASPKKPLTLDDVLKDVTVTAESTNTDVVIVNDPDELKKDAKGSTAQAAMRLTAMGPGTAYVTVKSKYKDGLENISVCKITVVTPVSNIKISGDSGIYISHADDGSETPEDITITIRQGSYDRLHMSVDPSDTTDIGKIAWSAKGGVTVKNGVIYAKTVSKKNKAGEVTPATVTVKCGKKSHTIKVIVIDK